MSCGSILVHCLYLGLITVSDLVFPPEVSDPFINHN